MPLLYTSLLRGLGALLLVLLTGRAQAQFSSALPLKISLQAEYFMMPTASFYIEQVVDARPDPRLPLGLAIRGLNSTLREIHLQQGAAAEFRSLLQNRLVGAAGAPPVLLRLTAIGVTEATSGAFSTPTAAELGLEYYARQPDSTYYLLCRTYHSAFQANGSETNRSHATNLAALLGQSLNQLSQVDWPGQQAAGPLYRPAQLRERLPEQPYAVQSSAARQPGVYASFFEFRQNAPSQPGHIAVEAEAYHASEWQGLRAVAPYRLTPEGQRVPVKDAWGFCDGQQMYIRFGRDYFLLEQRGQGYMFFAPALRNNNSTMLFNGGPPKTPYSLHLPTGFVTEYAGPIGIVSLKPAGRPTHLMVYWRHEKKAAPQPVLLNGQPAGELHENDYLSLPWQGAAGQAVRLCIGSAGCLDFVPSFDTPNYLEYKQGRLVVVPVREGTAQVSRMAGR